MNKTDLIKQIESYNLGSKLKDLAIKDEQKRPFRHLPKQFAKGILIANIAIVPKKHTEINPRTSLEHLRRSDEFLTG